MKNRKLFAIITLVAFMLTMMPIMAFATTASGSSISVEDGSAKVGDQLEFILDIDEALYDVSNEDAVVTAQKAVDNAKAAIDGYNEKEKVEEAIITFKDGKAVAGTATGEGGKGLVETYNDAVDAYAQAVENAEDTAIQGGDKIVVVFAERNGSLSEVDELSATGKNIDWSAPQNGVLIFTDIPSAQEITLTVTSETAGTVALKAYAISGASSVKDMDGKYNIANLYNGSGDFIKTAFVGNGVTGKFTTTDNDIIADVDVELYERGDKVKDDDDGYEDKTVEVNEDGVEDGATTDATEIPVEANNGVQYLKVSMQFFQGSQKQSKLVGEDVDIYVNKIGATVDKETVTTSATGRIDFKVSATKPGTYVVTVDCGSFTHDIKVDFDGTVASTPEFTFITNNTIAVDEKTSRVAEIALYDGLGNEVDFGFGNIAVEIVKAPEDSSMEDFEFGWEAADPGSFINEDGELAFTPDAVGTYEIKAYNKTTGVAAYATIKADEFGVVDHATISYPYANYALGAKTAVPTVKLVDKAGVVKDANKGACDYSYAGVGVVEFKDGQITFSNDKDYAGEEVTVSVVVSGRYAASTKLTIGAKAASINFADAQGQAAKDIKVTGQLVDLNGNNVALSNTDKVEVQSAVVISRPEGAIVAVDTDDFNYKNEFRNKGIANIVVTSNKEGTVQVNLVVEVTTKVEKVVKGETQLVDDVYYVAGVATVAVGETTADVEDANDIVTFIIGSSTFIANNKATTSDVAPYIVDGRTFIPVRAFVEATGATVEYDAVTQVVTIKGDGIDAQMTIGSNILTVNGETVVMDTAAAIKDGRTVLPVRYAGQAIGYDFECAYGANGAVTAVTMFK